MFKFSVVSYVPYLVFVCFCLLDRSSRQQCERRDQVPWKQGDQLEGYCVAWEPMKLKPGRCQQRWEAGGRGRANRTHKGITSLRTRPVGLAPRSVLIRVLSMGWWHGSLSREVNGWCHRASRRERHTAGQTGSTIQHDPFIQPTTAEQRTLVYGTGQWRYM